MYNRNQYFQENYPLFILRTQTSPLIDLPYTLPLSLHIPCPPLHWQQNRGPEIFTHITETKIKEAGEFRRGKWFSVVFFFFFVVL